MPVRLHPEARFELIEGQEWYRLTSERHGHEFTRAFDAAVEMISRFPFAGRPDGPVRLHHLSGYPYTIVYRTLEVSVEIVAVAHTSRQPGYWAHRLR